MKKGVVSVIIPNYNYAHYLRETLDSVFAQTYPEIEIIVVDDGSSDGSREILESFGARIVSIFQKNKGVAAARNNGVGASSGEYVAFLDADDAWLPQKIEKQVEKLSQNTKLGLVHVGVEEVDAELRPLVRRLEGVEGNVAPTLLMLKREGVLGGGSGLMVPRRVFDEIGGFDERLSTSADWDLQYRVSERYGIGFVPEILLKYRVHGSNMHANVGALEHDMKLAFAKAFATPAADVAAVRRAAYGSLHQILAGSYYHARNYPAFIANSMKSLYFNPRNISYFLSFGRRGANRRGVEA
jgi:glycosyltransferase involved in cell wall biosynthesis